MRAGKRNATAGLFGLLVLLGLAPTAWAHGGRFRGPTGSVPPEMRDPHDPPAPPPPPPASGPPVTPGPSGGPVTPGGPAPVTPPAPATPNTPPGVPTDFPSGGGRRSQVTYESWAFWYANNNEGIERLKEAIYTQTTSESVISVLGGSREPAGTKGGITQPTVTKVNSHVIPALLWAFDPRNAADPDVEGAAYIALAKVTRDPAHIDLILRGLKPRTDGAKEDAMVRECAALALGLLCRRSSAEPFAAAELDRVRERLFEVLEDGRGYGTRTRGLAAVSLGLLGDQPTGSAQDATLQADAARATVERLYDLLGRDHAAEDLPIGLLLALGLQERTKVPEPVLAGLTEGALKGRLAGRPVSAVVQSYAVLALARLGDARTVRPLANLLTGRATHVHVRRSAAIGLGLLGRLLTPDDRVALAKALREGIEKGSDASARNFALMSLAYLAAHDAEAGRADVLVDARIGEFLVEQARSGAVGQRPFAALALGWIGKAIGDRPQTASHAAFRQEALVALREGLAGKALEARNRAAFAVALGMSRDMASRAALLSYVGDRREDRELRGYAAVGVGLLGPAALEVAKTLRAVVAERASEELTLHAATALGLVRDASAVDLLVQTLRDLESQHAKGQVVLALSKIGDARAIEPLVSLLRDPRESANTRALACAGLGAVGDLEWIPSLSKVSRDINYRASVDLVTEVLSIL
jgi:HEAT repeat protein